MIFQEQCKEILILDLEVGLEILLKKYYEKISYTKRKFKNFFF